MRSIAMLCGWTALLVGLAGTTPVGAVTMTFSDRALFEGQLGTTVVDDYSDPGYTMGDKSDLLTLDFFTNEAMSAIVGETEYTTTGWSNNNIVTGQDVDPYYCAGCDGSFRLTFTTTSVGDTSGVFGVGFDFFNEGNPAYHAFVMFGDDSTMNIALPEGGSTGAPESYIFFGITSDLAIKSIHLGRMYGDPTDAGYFGMDDLTVGNPIPEPSTFLLLGFGLMALAAGRQRR